MKRVLTSLVLIPPVLLVIFASDRWVLLCVIALVASLCYREYLGIVTSHGIPAFGPIGYAAGLLLLVLPQVEMAALTLLALIALSLAMRADDLGKSLPQAAALLLGVVYIFGPWRAAAGLREMNAHWLLFALVINWLGDVAAYYVGRSFGRHAMAPRVSPRKTWEGAAASTVASMAFGIVYLGRFLPQVPLVEAAALSVAANAAGQLGDLAESALKRGANLKDSGTWLPGHGGWLDRLDSSLFTLPVVYLLASKRWPL